MADGVVCFQSELFHNFQSAVAEAESLSCRSSEQLVKRLPSRVGNTFGWSGSVRELQAVGKLG